MFNRQLAVFIVPAVWGLVIFVSWIGWGQLLSRIIFGKGQRAPDLGMAAGWGACVTIFFGGILNAFRACSVGTVVALVGIGVAACVADMITSGGLRRRKLHFPLGYLPLVALWVLIYAGSVCWRTTWIRCDDFLAYLVYPIKMLQTGAAIDPFSFRRLSTPGGYAFLQATIAVMGKPENTFLLDIGLGGLLNCLLTVPFLRRAGCSPLMSSLGGIICLLMPLGRISSMSYDLGMAGFILLFRTLDYFDSSKPEVRARLCWVAGGVAGAVSAMRPNFLPAAAFMLILSEIFWTVHRRSKWSAAAIDVGWMALGGLVCIIPWCIVLHSAADSWFFPVFRGNLRNGIDVFARHISRLATAKFVIAFFLRPKMLLLVAAGSIVLAVSRLHARALWIGAIVFAAVGVSQFTASDISDLSRYMLPFLAAAMIVGWLSTQYEAPLVAKLGRAFMVVLVLVLLVWNCVSRNGAIRASLSSLHASVLKNLPLYDPREAPLYTAAQASVPPGSTILTLVDYPFLLDYRRNVMYSADWPGLASPDPGIPFFQGSGAFERYLKSQSIDYVMFVNFDKGCVDFDPGSATFFERDLYFPGAINHDSIFRMAGTRALDFLHNIDSLAANSPVVFNRDDLRVIRIR